MVRKGNLAIFEGSSISETREGLPTKIGVHVCDINPYLHEFFEPNPGKGLATSHGHDSNGCEGSVAMTKDIFLPTSRLT